MVSFQCEGCGDVVTKKKLDSHRNRCGSSFVCLDCSTEFFGTDYRSHTSCITEAQKYQGSTYKERRPKKKMASATQTIAPPAAFTPLQPMRKPKHAYVTDVDEAMSPTGYNFISPSLPPPAPSPPPITSGDVQPSPVNVFDFLVDDDPNSRPTTASTHASGYTNGKQSGLDTPFSMMDAAPPAPSPPPATVRPSTFHEDVGYVYGDAPIERSMQRFDSDYDLLLREPRQDYSPRKRHSMHSMQTPGPIIETRRPPDARSDKKRKRPNVDDLDLGLIRDAEGRKGADRGLLHSGLTGGLTKLLSRSSSGRGPAEEESPLSPKRTRHVKREAQRRESHSYSNGNGHKQHDLEEKDSRRRKHDRGSSDDSFSGQHKKPKAIEGRKDLKAIEYYGASHALEKVSSRGSSSHSSHSELFLSLIDKDYRSSRGQSIWGALKMFHDGVQGDMSDKEYRSSGLREQEEKRLLKGLRLKLNRQGEIVLFARPASEQDGA